MWAATGLIWFVTIKSYALSTLLLFGALVLAEQAQERRSGRRWALCGGLLGLAIDARLLFALAVPAFIVAIWQAPLRIRTRFAGGVVVGLLPSLYFLARYPHQFVFNVVGFHADRTGSGPFNGVGQKATRAFSLLTDPQFSLLLFAVLAAFVYLKLRGGRTPLSISVAALLAVAGLLPNPSYGQYFSVLTPFLVLGCLELVAPLRQVLTEGKEGVKQAAWAVLAGAAVVYFLGGIYPPFQTVHQRTAATVRIGSVRSLTEYIDAHTKPGEHVLSSWPGYLLGSHAVAVRNTENDWSSLAAAISPANEALYHSLSRSEIDALITGHRVRFVVFGVDRQWRTGLDEPDWEASIRAAHARLVHSTPAANFYALHGSGS